MKNKEHSDFCEEKNFSDFFRKNSELLHNFIYYKCGNFEMTNDLVQDSFLRKIPEHFQTAKARGDIVKKLEKIIGF